MLFSHSARLTIVYLAKKNFGKTKLMEWPPASLGISPVENIRSNIYIRTENNIQAKRSLKSNKNCSKYY